MTSRAAPPCCSTDRCDTGVLRQRATGAPFLYGCCDIALIAARPGIMHHHQCRAAQDRVVRGVVEHDGVVGNSQLALRDNAGRGGDDGERQDLTARPATFRPCRHRCVNEKLISTTGMASCSGHSSARGLACFSSSSDGRAAKAGLLSHADENLKDPAPHIELSKHQAVAEHDCGTSATCASAAGNIASMQIRSGLSIAPMELICVSTAGGVR